MSVLAGYDLIVVAFYIVFMLSIGPVFKRFNRNSSDYFRGGGSMLWWLVGASAFMTTFSAWSFTGAAGKIYTTGTLVLALFFSNALAYLLTFLFTAHRFRRMRVVTYVEAIRNRFGKVNEQFFTWFPVPFFLLLGGTTLYAVAVFMAAVFDLSPSGVTLAIGVLITFASMLGGSWAVVASDFMQMMVVVMISLIVTVLVLLHPDVGGVSGLLEKVPSSHLNWAELADPKIIIFWIVMLCLNQIIMMNSLSFGAARFLFVKNEAHARKATLVPMIGMLVFPVIWIVPAMAAAFLHPNLAADFPRLNNPSEAAYVAVAMDVLPPGMLGLLICGIFAASISTLDSSLNRLSGIFIKNVYLPLIRSSASEKNQIFWGRILTVILGAMVTGLALFLARLEGLALFEAVLLIASCIGLPMAIPMALAMFIRKTPSWAGWSCGLLGLLISLGIRLFLKAESVAVLLGMETLSAREFSDLYLGVQILLVTVICTAWYLFSRFFYRNSRPAFKADHDEFYTRMETPLNPAEDSEESDPRQFCVMGMLCLVYGGFIFVMGFLPNSAAGHWAFFTAGGVVAGIGILLRHFGTRKVKERI